MIQCQGCTCAGWLWEGEGGLGDHQPGVYVPLKALFLVFYAFHLLQCLNECLLKSVILFFISVPAAVQDWTVTLYDSPANCDATMVLYSWTEPRLTDRNAKIVEYIISDTTQNTMGVRFTVENPDPYRSTDRAFSKVITHLTANTLYNRKVIIVQKFVSLKCITKTCPCINIQRIFFSEKKKNHRKKFDIFLSLAQNIDCGYTLEPPCRVLTIYVLDQKYEK